MFFFDLKFSLIVKKSQLLKSIKENTSVEKINIDVLNSSMIRNKKRKISKQEQGNFLFSKTPPKEKL